jgi:hypothetical protein
MLVRIDLVLNFNLVDTCDRVSPIVFLSHHVCISDVLTISDVVGFSLQQGGFIINLCFFLSLRSCSIVIVLLLGYSIFDSSRRVNGALDGATHKANHTSCWLCHNTKEATAYALENTLCSLLHAALDRLVHDAGNTLKNSFA